MAWDFGCGDIVAGIRIALTIYEYGFTEENAADHRYREFRNDILNFGLLLERLDRSLRDAQRRYYDGGLFARAERAHDPLAEDFESERIVIIGNFKATLRACEAVLNENKKFRTRYATVLESLKWHFIQQQELRIDDLRRRLYFHCEKIRLVIDRLSVTLLTEADSKLDNILAVTTENLQLSQDILDELRFLRCTLLGGDADGRQVISRGLLTIAPALARRFEQALTVNAPTAFTSELPLVEAFDALYYRFEQSIQGSEQSAEKQLQLLKCCWILEQIKASPQYLEASPAFYYRRAVNQLDIAIRTRIRRSTNHASYDHNAVLAFPDDVFEIWLPRPAPPPAPTVPLQPNPLLKRANERQVAQIKLATDGPRAADMVHVYQHSDENYRIALETYTPAGERYIREQQLYTREHRLIPMYALPTMPDPIPELSIFSHNESHFYRFSTFEDLWRFQAAFTGYEVSHDQPEVRCQLGPNLESMVCNSRIQLWQDPIEFSSQSTVPAALAGPVQNGTGRAHSSTNSRRDSFAPSLAHTTNFTRTPDGLIAESVKLSAMVMFTQLEHRKHGTRFAIIFLDLRDNVYIDREACACKHGYDGCSKLVIAARKKARLPLRILFAVTNGGISDPNTFDVLPLRLPRRHDFNSIKPRESEHIVLKFIDLNAKKRFDLELQYRFAVRDKQRELMDDIDKRLLHMSNHPLRREQYLARHQSLQQSTGSSLLSTAGSTLGPPPRLARPEMGPPIGVAIAHGTDPRSTHSNRGGSDSTSMSTSPLSNGSIGSASVASRTNSTAATEWERHELPASTSGGAARLPALLDGYRVGPEGEASRTRVSMSPPYAGSNIANSWREARERLSAVQQALPQQTHPLLQPRRATDAPSLAPAEYLPRRGTATTFQTTATSPSRLNTNTTFHQAANSNLEPTAQSPERQEENGRASSRSSSTRGWKAFGNHVLRSL